MVEIGKVNKLKVARLVGIGAYLESDNKEEILLPKRYVPEGVKVGDLIDAFICYDSEDRLIATTETPKATVGDFALLKVVAVERVGAFLDWGISKDLLLPFAEQTSHPRVGQNILVYVYIDKTDRIAASMRLDRHLEKVSDEYQEGQEVDLLIASRTDLGFKAIINNRHVGVLYKNEVFKPLPYGFKTKGFIKHIREDGKIDLSLNKTGHKAADPIAEKILELLNENEGFLEITDKTSPEQIYELFGASKKKFKIALGGLYKKRLISISDNGITLEKKN
jgi:hypothetical protein